MGCRFAIQPATPDVNRKLSGEEESNDVLFPRPHLHAPDVMKAE
jgi:hypothetical protein